MGRDDRASAAVEVRDLHYEVGDRVLLRSADLTVVAGESVAVMGPSGCGKTTLLSCLAGLLKPSKGVVRIADQDVIGMSSGRRAALRLASVGMVYQFGELLPELSPTENVVLPALLAGIARDEAYGRAKELLADLGLSDARSTDTGSLSGGERQRVAVARALIGHPRVILADEPTGALDIESSHMVSELLFALPQRYDCALVVVTHNPQVAVRAGRVLHMADGVLSHAPHPGASADSLETTR